MNNSNNSDFVSTMCSLFMGIIALAVSVPNLGFAQEEMIIKWLIVISLAIIAALLFWLIWKVKFSGTFRDWIKEHKSEIVRIILTVFVSVLFCAGIIYVFMF